MKFDQASAVDMVCYQMKLADYPRALNRARINDLFNGVPPYTDQEAADNNISINVNSLEGTRLSHDARSQFYSAFLKPGNYFTCRTDYGPGHRRSKWNTVVTKEVNRIMKRSIPFFECFRSKFAMNVLHGISPSGFRDQECWCPEPFGVEDVMIPANTLLTMRNLPFFAIHHSFTGPELIRLTRGPSVDKAWNMPLVEACIKWIDDKTLALMGTNWPEVWSPEKMSERIKGDGGFYVGDQVPTIDCWDFYFWNDDNKVSGWNRRMILDSWSTPANLTSNMTRKSGDIYDGRDQFLYNPGDRKFADKRENIINWQFADLSAVAPFRYHSVRALGFLLYGACHLQNRLRCKFNESVFEQLMMYFRVKSESDFQRALRVDLINRGFLDDTVEFIKAADRYQVNAPLAELGLSEGARMIQANASSWTANPNTVTDNKEKTAMQFMGELQSMTQMVSASLTQAYMYQVPEYREIFRRFCIPESNDPDVKAFQAACVKQGVPLKALCDEYWDIEPERVMGAGNKTLEMNIAQQLMQFRNLYDPEPQRKILRDVTLAITEDPARAEDLVPEAPQVSNTIHDTELVFAALMQVIPVTPKSGVNNIEVIEVMLKQMANRVAIVKQTGGVGTPQEVAGLTLAGQYTGAYIQKLAQDPNEKQRVRQYGDALGNIMNEVKAMAQRQQEQAQKSNGQGGPDPEAMAKIEAMRITAEAKAANTRESHAQRTAQRQIQFQMEQEQKQQQHRMDLSVEAAKADLQLKVDQAKAEQAIAVDRAKAEAKMKSETQTTSE